MSMSDIAKVRMIARGGNPCAGRLRGRLWSAQRRDFLRALKNKRERAYFSAGRHRRTARAMTENRVRRRSPVNTPLSDPFDRTAGAYRKYLWQRRCTRNGWSFGPAECCDEASMAE